MAEIKIPLVSLKYIIPEDLEYYLEQQAAQGYLLKPVGQTGFFFYTFEKTEPKKCRYAVDYTKLSKEIYFPKMSELDWEYLGKVGNCVIWRKSYEKDRPDDIVDHISRQSYLKLLGGIFLAIMILCVAAAIALTYGVNVEVQHGLNRYRVRYIIEAVLQLPFILYFGWGARKLLSFVERIPKRKLQKKESED